MVHGRGVEPLCLAAVEPKNELSPTTAGVPDDFEGSDDDGRSSMTLQPRVAAASWEPSDADLEAAIVKAMLGGNGTTADVLSERLRERLRARAGVSTLPGVAYRGPQR